MPSPFPGMGPFLENPELWSGFHASFIAELQTLLSPILRPDFFVRIEERLYAADENDPAYRLIVPDARVIAARNITTPPRVLDGNLLIAEPIPVIEIVEEEIRETRLEIHDRADRSVVAVIELVSPTNKVPASKGRASFLKKREEIYRSPAHWVEIDLLYNGVRTAHYSPAVTTAYQTYLSRGGAVRKSFAWPMPFREPLPVIGIPLRGDHADAPLNLQTAFDNVYDRGGYDLDLNYSADPLPTLSPADRAWVTEITAGMSRG